jgi:hypothetical protein
LIDRTDATFVTLIDALLGSVLRTGIGAVVAWNGWRSDGGRRSRVADATEVRAEITDVGVAAERRAIDADDGEGGAGATRTEYVPRVTFEYTFDGERHTASTVEPPSAGAEATHRSPTESGARDHHDHEVGDTVTAHVDPARPGEGVLEPATGTTRDLVLAVGGVAMVVLGVGFAVASVAVRRDRRVAGLNSVGSERVTT